MEDKRNMSIIDILNRGIYFVKDVQTTTAYPYTSIASISVFALITILMVIFIFVVIIISASQCMPTETTYTGPDTEMTTTSTDYPPISVASNQSSRSLSTLWSPRFFHQQLSQSMSTSRPLPELLPQYPMESSSYIYDTPSNTSITSKQPEMLSITAEIGCVIV